MGVLDFKIYWRQSCCAIDPAIQFLDDLLRVAAIEPFAIVVERAFSRISGNAFYHLGPWIFRGAGFPPRFDIHFLRAGASGEQ